MFIRASVSAGMVGRQPPPSQRWPGWTISWQFTSRRFEPHVPMSAGTRCPRTVSLPPRDWADVGSCGLGVPENAPVGRSRLSAWLRERPFDHRIVLVTGWLGDAVAASGGSGAHDLGATGDD